MDARTTDEELDLPYNYWIPKMHKNPYKHRFIAGSSKCSTKPLSILLATIIRNSFIHKNKNLRYKFLVLGRERPYVVKEQSDSKSKYTEDDIIDMLEFLVDNIFVVFRGKVV